MLQERLRKSLKPHNVRKWSSIGNDMIHIAAQIAEGMTYLHDDAQWFVGDQVEQQSRRVNVKPKFELTWHLPKCFCGGQLGLFIWVLSMAYMIVVSGF